MFSRGWIHPAEHDVQFGARRTARMLGSAVGDFQLAAFHPSHHRISELVHVHAEGVKTRTAEVRVDRRRDDLDHLNRRGAELMTQREREGMGMALVAL